MKNCKDIQSVINEFGRAEFDVSMWSSGNKVEPLSGFYYSTDQVKTGTGEQLTLTVMYPRPDAFPFSSVSTMIK
ncbi:MAG: hypothetical protein ACK50Y_01210 [Flavobacteriia bacterium]